MTEQERKLVEEIRAMEALATEGPWEAIGYEDDDDITLMAPKDRPLLDIGVSFANHDDYDDGKSFCDINFMVSARSDIPFLLDLVKRQEEEIGRLPCNGCKWSGMIRPQKCATCCRNKHMKDNYQEATP